MEDLLKLQQLSLVSKVCTELENNCGLNDPTLGKPAPMEPPPITMIKLTTFPPSWLPVSLLRDY